MQHSGVGFALVQALNVPVLQVVEQSVEVVSFFRNSLPLVAEQVIEVPKLALPDGFLLRSFPLEPQLAEQLLEVPTEPAYVEQNVDNPVPRGRHGRHPGSLRTGINSVCDSRLPTFLLPVEVFAPRTEFNSGCRAERSHSSSTLWRSSWWSSRFSSGSGLRSGFFHFLLETLMKGLFALFPRRLVLTPGRNWPRTRAHPRRALMAL